MDKEAKKSVRPSILIAAAIAVVIAVVAAVLHDRDVWIVLLFFALFLLAIALVLFPLGLAMDQAGNKSLRASLKSAAVIDTVLYVVDAVYLSVVMDHSLIAQFLFGVVLLYFFPASIWALRRDRRVAKLRAAKAAVYLFAAVVVVVTSGLQKRMTNRRAVKLGDACMAYRAKYHHYPKDLDALVPEFISSVPVAKYGLRGIEPFEYFGGAGGDYPTLCLPQMTLTCYQIESHMWTSHRAFN